MSLLFVFPRFSFRGKRSYLSLGILDLVCSQMCQFVSQFLLLLWRLLLCLDTCSGWRILIYCDSPLVILSFSFFIPLLYSVAPWGGSSYLVGKSVKYRYIKVFVF